MMRSDCLTDVFFISAELFMTTFYYFVIWKSSFFEILCEKKMHLSPLYLKINLLDGNAKHIQVQETAESQTAHFVPCMVNI